SRNVIQGRKYHCGAGVFSHPVLNIENELDCTSGKEFFLALESHRGNLASSTDQIVYKLDPATATTPGRLQKSTDSGLNFDYVTAPTINIDKLKFYVFGNAVGDDEVPRVVIILGGTAGAKEGTQSSFNIQTMATQRAPE
ncbi:MAG: hypothetical protein KAI72_00360, partial [Candidatus Pacebacteria bacterium]|nr:hypothetical protein [Candidatus Paceibacterota bacterium]